MNLRLSACALPLTTLTCAILAACGGGSGGSSSSGASSTMSGTVAVGAPMSNATITIKGANGVTVSTTAATDGSYSGVDLSTLTAPYRIEACGVVDGSQACYYSMVSGSGTANVTPLTNAALALTVGGDASQAFTDANGPDASTLESKLSSLKTALAPVLTAAGLPAGTDLATTPFTADRTGMDKVLDAVKISTGKTGGHSFVQLEGRLGSGNFFVDDSGSSAGSLSSGSVASNMAVDLTGISTVFHAMSTAIGQASQGACVTSMNSAGIFDASFSLSIDGGPTLTASTVANAICTMASTEHLLEGRVANPVLHDCDFSQADKFCTVGFDVVHGDNVFEGAELTVVKRSGSSTWQLLGQEEVEIHVNASVQRTLRINIANPQPHYTRAISFDVATNSGTYRYAKVYQHAADGLAWDSTPIAQLSDQNGTCTDPRLTMLGSQCGSTWLSLDSFNNGSLADGDAMIDAFYRRGRVVKIELYTTADGSGSAAKTVYKRVDGVPPKAADLDGLPWLELDSASKTALVNYASGAPDTLAVSWAANRVVMPHDVSGCQDSSCSTRYHDNISLSEARNHAKTLDLSSLSGITNNGYKMLSLYGRTREEMGVASNYVSCSNSDPACPAN
ncbi:MAG TPA: hypothetical protein VFM48_10200 [Aquabacterium sp.]|nr:hypothetical protein [Aquabacterium sp.]